jgi:type II secretory pathway component PulJ
MTLTELMIVLMVAVLIAIAASSMYVASFETWQVAGAKLALQRSADEAFVRMTSDIRQGTEVSLTKSGTEMSIMLRGTSVGDSTVGTYTYANDELQDVFGNTVLTQIDSLEFDVENMEKVRIRVRLVDDRNTPEDPWDDVTQWMETAAVCRNREIY